MADGVPPASGGERIDVAARPRGDDEGLKNAFAALLGLQAEDGGAPKGTPTAVSLPPRRTSPQEWAPPEGLDDPPRAADDFWSSSGDEPPASAWAPADAPEPAPPAEPAPPPGPWMAHEDRDDEFWAAPVADVPPVTAAPGLSPSADLSAPEVDEPRLPDLSLPAADRDVPPHVPGDRAEEPAVGASSLAGLQDVGLGGPLNTAMGDLRRLADDRLGPPAPPADTRGGSLRASFDHRVVLLREWWGARRRELLPGVGVALLIVVAFAVVLLNRDGDPRPVGTVSTSVPPASAPQSTLPPAEETTTVPLPPEDVVPTPPIEPSAGAPARQSSTGAGGDRAPSAARTQPPTRGAQAPAPAPATAPKPAPAPSPTAPPGTPATTQAPPTSTPSTSRPPQSSDPCDNAWTPAARQACLDSRDQGGDD
jgi:hypothetical protein